MRSGPNRPNQTEIAKAAGVARSTVSLALRDGTNLSLETVTRVKAVAESMGYRPNSLVDGIKTGRTRTIGLFVHPWDSYWTEVLNGICDRLAEADHSGVLFLDKTRLMGRNPDFALTQVHRALDQWCDAVILWPFFASLYASHMEEFSKRRIPIVTIDHALDERFKADAIETNEMEIVTEGLDHLLSLGHKHVLVIGGRKGHGWADERVAAVDAYFGATGEAKFKLIRVSAKEDAVQPTLERLRAPGRPTGIFACTDHYAADAYVAARLAGLQIPTDISIVGVSDLNFSALLSPPLTTVRQDGYAVGRMAAQMALDRITRTIRGKPVEFRLNPQLVVRQSTGPAAR